MYTPAVVPYLSGRASLGRLRALGCAFLLLQAGTAARAQHLIATTQPWGYELRAMAVDPGTHQVFVLDQQIGVMGPGPGPSGWIRPAIRSTSPTPGTAR